MKHSTLYTYGLLLICCAHNIGLTAQTSIRGRVIEKTDKVSIPFARIEIFRDGILIDQTYSDNEGRFQFLDLPLGKYDLISHSIGHLTQQASNIDLLTHHHINVNLNLTLSGYPLDQFCIVKNEKPKSLTSREL